MSGENILEVERPHQTFQIIRKADRSCSGRRQLFAIPKGKTLGHGRRVRLWKIHLCQDGHPDV